MAPVGSRRRSGWRKRADIDEELWPTEAFGGVSDEQFWDDLASDKPLATTARTAGQDSGSRRRPPDAVPLPGPGDTLAPGDHRARGSDHGRSDGRRIAGADSDAYPGPRPGLSGPAGHPRLQAYQAGPQQAQTGPQPYQTGPQPYQTGPQPYQTGPQAAQTGPQPAYADADRAEARRRSREEDPLTSAAFSLRSSGPVDGRSYQTSRRSRDLTREQYEAAISQETQTFSLADAEAATGGYPGGVPPFRQYDPLPGGSGGRTDGGSGRADGYRSGYPHAGAPHSEQVQSMNTPPYGESYGYGLPSDDPRRPNGRPGGDGSRGTRPAYPQDAYQRGVYPQGTYPQGNGYRGPQAPRGDDRR